MINIRKSDGSVTPIENGVFVEIVNDIDQSIGLVFFQPRPGVVLQIPPGGADAMRYENMFRKSGVKFTKKLIQRA